MNAPRLLKLTSCQSENSEHVGRALTRYLEERLDIATEFVADVPWRERERLLDAGEIHAGWICGLPYALRADRPRPCLELLAAPVMAGTRYAGRPVYFSDIVVRSDSRARTFADLRGARWGYNEPGSHSGYNIVRYQLSRLGEAGGYFARVVETGAHQATLEMIADGQLDASAIDSTVLEIELRARPSLRGSLRVIESWGPSPAPPWVVSRCVSAGLRRRMRNALNDMHKDAAGREMLRQAGMKRFTPVSDRHYDPIRAMSRAARDVVL